MAFAGKLTQAQVQEILILKGANMLRFLHGRLNAIASYVLFKGLPRCVKLNAKDPATKFSKRIRCEDRSLSLAEIGFGYDVWKSHSTDDIHELTPGELSNILAVAGSFVDLKGYTPQGRAMTRRLADSRAEWTTPRWWL